MTRRHLLAVMIVFGMAAPFHALQEKPAEAQLQTVTLTISGMT
jgi:hypothetical protein